MILLYHHVIPPHRIPPPASWDRLDGWEFSVSPEQFEAHLIKLKKMGYQFISMDRLVDYIRESGYEPRKTAVITFDDGWADNHQYALPILKKMNCPAAFFLTTEQFYEGHQNPKKMSVAQVKELLLAGMTMGAHTKNHVDLTALPPEEARKEIAVSKIDLERLLGISVAYFSYPGGAFNRRAAGLVKEAGFKAACSVLGPAKNTPATFFWMFRDVLTPGMNSARDYYRLTPILRNLLEFRVKSRLSRILRG